MTVAWTLNPWRAADSGAAVEISCVKHNERKKFSLYGDLLGLYNTIILMLELIGTMYERL